MLLEREKEIERMAALVEQVRGGSGAVLLVEGEAGVGKTALLGELRARAAEARMTALSARGAQVEKTFPYGIARQLLEPTLTAAQPKRRASLLAGAAGHAQVVLGAEPGTEDEPADGGLRALHGLYWLVVNLADEAPVVLVVDDAHWADEASLAWLGYLARRADDLRLAIAVGARPEGTQGTLDLLDALADGPLATVVRPRPLRLPAVAALVGEELGAEPEPAFVEASAEVSGGNPFFLRELLRAAREDGLAPTAACAGRVALLGPDRVVRSVSRRVEAAGAAAAACARALSVLDGASPVALVASVAGLSPSEVLLAGEALTRSGIVTSEGALDFAHPILRAAVYEDTGLADRAALHLRAAGALAAANGDVERIAAHLIELPPGSHGAGDVLDPVAVLRRAAAQAVARGAPAAAVGYLCRALGEPVEPGVQRALELELARAELRVRDQEGFERYQRLIGSAEGPAERAELALELTQALAISSDFARAAEVAHEALQDPEVPAPLRRFLEAELLVGEMFTVSLRERALPHLEALGARESTGELHPGERAVLAHGLALLGREMELATRLATEAMMDPRMAEVGTNSGMFGAVIHALLLSDGRDALDPFFAVLLEEGRASDDATVLIWGSALRGQLALSRGDLLGAEADFSTMLELLPADEGPAARAWVLAPAAIVLALRGRADEAASLLAGRAPAPPFPSTYSYALLRYGRGVVAMQQGRLTEALDELLDVGESVAGAPFAPEALPWRSAAAECQVRLGKGDAALELAQAELEAAQAAGVSRAIGRALVSCALPEEGGERISRLREAVQVLEGADALLELARAQVELGAALRRAGRRVEAREVLRAGVDAASRCAAAPLLERGREELASAGARPQRERLGGPQSLTAAERRVVELAASGSSNREIAQALYLTQKTVESHLSSAYRKLDVSSRHKLGEVLEPAGAPAEG